MINNDMLIKSLKEELKQYNYIEHIQGLFNNVDYLSIIATPRRFATRYICSITNLPEDVNELSQVSIFFEQIRKSLINQYAKFPYFKELGTYNIIFCSDHMYEIISEHLEKFVDKSGLHMNVMLGTIFINTNTYEHMYKSTWGLYYSGKHFEAMLKEVSTWCENQIDV